MERASVALGSNLGDRLGTLRSARAALAELGRVVAESSIWSTAPVGGPEQPPFYNAVVVLETALPPLELLDAMLAIEVAHGRVRDPARDVRWGPRTLDLDLLLYGEREVDVPRLDVPHPRLHERAFVLAPLLEAWPAASHPRLGPLAPVGERVLAAAGDVVRTSLRLER